MKLLILADDFTGAMDTGVQLSKAQIKTLVFSKLPDRKRKATLPPCEVLVFNTNLRHETPEAAYQIITDLLKTYYEPGLYVYMKTDSALRGNISATLAAATDTLQLPIHFIPAFPDAGRTTRNGIVYIGETPLEASVFRNDPRSPMTESSLEKIVTRDYPFDCRLVSAPSSSSQTIYKETNSLSEDVLSCSGAAGEHTAVSLNTQDTGSNSAAPKVYLYDGSTNEDLAAIASFLKEQDALTLTAGCAGFAKQFPKQIAFSKEAPYTPDAPGPILILSGSANAITFGQLAKAREEGYPLFLMKAYMEASIKGESSCKELEDTLVQNAVSLLIEGKSVILATAQDTDSLLDFPALTAFTGSVEAVHMAISGCTCRLARRILEAVEISCLTVFGGDTVAGILEELGCTYVYAKGEIDTGVPLCLLPYKSGSSGGEGTLHLITKSGGLGCEDIVKSIDKYFNSL